MLKLLRKLKIDKPGSAQDHPGPAVATGLDGAPHIPNEVQWQDLSTKLLTRLATAAQTSMPQMPAPTPAPRAPKKTTEGSPR